MKTRTQERSLIVQLDYSFPPELIAQSPASPRDAARLLVYRKHDKKVSYDTFKNLAKYLPPRAVLVFNETKVIPARLFVRKETGGPRKRGSPRGGWGAVWYIAKK